MKNFSIWKGKYFWWSVVAVVLWLGLSDWIIHQKLLKDMYLETASMWRTETDIQQHFWWMFVGQFLIAFWMCWIFPYGFKNQGPWEGIRFGLWIGLFSCAHYFVQYAVSPMPSSLLWAWCLLTLAQSMAAGWIVGKVWHWNPVATKTLQF